MRLPEPEPESDPAVVIRSARLDLIALTVPALEALLRGDPESASAIVGATLAPDLGERAEPLLRMRLDQLRATPSALPWLLRVVALRDEGRPMVGLTGFHRPPDITGSVEVGYEIAPSFRGRGYATEAAAAVTAWAFGRGVRRVIAGIRPDNAPSLAVVARLGFRRVGSRWDAVDGTAVLFERRSPPTWPPALPGNDAAGTSGAKMQRTRGDRLGARTAGGRDDAGHRDLPRS